MNPSRPKGGNTDETSEGSRLDAKNAPQGVVIASEFTPSALYPMFRHVNRSLVAWAMRKYKRLGGHKTRASIFLETISKKTPRLFVHWQKGTVGAFA
jgi:hypothetical protein